MSTALRVGIIGLLLQGCGHKDSPVQEDPPGDSATEPLVFDGFTSAELLVEASKLYDRQIVYLGPGSAECPEVERWIAEPLFGEARSYLGAWCAYTQQERDADASAGEELRRALAAQGAQIAEMAPDRAILVGAADYDELMADVTTQFDARFAALTGAVAFVGDIDPGRVRLALVDDSPTSSDGQSPFTVGEGGMHGLALANIARRMLCVGPGEGCPVAITTQQAMFPSELSTDSMAASSGTVLELANAIVQEVEDWDGSTQHLVLNLSLGWNPLHGREEDDAAFFAVKRALVYARCRGVIPVAAAGNLGGGLDDADEGLILPAGWFSETVDAQTCQDEVGLDGSALGLTASTDVLPLVYSVASLSGEGQVGGLNRDNGVSPLLAMGDHAVARTPDGLTLPPMTGTSVSTLVVSASLAALLYSRPEETPASLDELIRGAYPYTDNYGALTPPAVSPEDEGDGRVLSDYPSAVWIGLGYGLQDASESNLHDYYRSAQAGTRLDVYFNSTAAHAVPFATVDELSYAVGSEVCANPDLWCSEAARAAFGASWCEGPDSASDDGAAAACTQEDRQSAELSPRTFPQPVWSDCPSCMIGPLKDPNRGFFLFVKADRVDPSQSDGGYLRVRSARGDGSGAVVTELFPLPRLNPQGNEYLSIEYKVEATFMNQSDYDILSVVLTTTDKNKLVHQSLIGVEGVFYY